MKKAPPPEEKGESAPLWILSFADMISLLMAFFVMLMTMATAKSGKICNDGMGVFEHSVGGFRKSVSGFGMPELFGAGNESLDFESPQAHYANEAKNEKPAADSDQQTRDAREEKTRRIFSVLDRKARTYKPEMKGSDPVFSVAPIGFAAGSAQLDDTAKTFLSNYASALQQNDLATTTIYVVGLAPYEKNVRDQWLISAGRANNVAMQIKQNLPVNTKLKIYSWGAGAGGDWSTNSGPISKEGFIMIATLRNTPEAEKTAKPEF